MYLPIFLIPFFKESSKYYWKYNSDYPTPLVAFYFRQGNVYIVIRLDSLSKLIFSLVLFSLLPGTPFHLVPFSLSTLPFFQPLFCAIDTLQVHSCFAIFVPVIISVSTFIWTLTDSLISISAQSHWNLSEWSLLISRFIIFFSMIFSPCICVLSYMISLLQAGILSPKGAGILFLCAMWHPNTFNRVCHRVSTEKIFAESKCDVIRELGKISAKKKSWSNYP